ncbi:6275_t:CDS:1, partial [Racocetra fulgida]
APYDEVNEFITEKIWREVLYTHMKATDQTALKKNPEIFKKLSVFVCQAIKTILIMQDNHKDTQNAIRKCNEYTIDLKIPTKL